MAIDSFECKTTVVLNFVSGSLSEIATGLEAGIFFVCGVGLSIGIYHISGFIGKSNIWRFVKKQCWRHFNLPKCGKMGDKLIHFVCAS